MKKWLVALVCALLLFSPLMVGGLVVFLLLGGAHGQQAGAGAGSCVVAAGSTEEVTVAGVTLSREQVGHAAAIIATGASAQVGQTGQIEALITALQETTMRNLANEAVPESMALSHDGVGANFDSVGLFQQRPSQGWGEPGELMDPGKAAGKFYERLKKVPGWEQMGYGQAAQAVQVSAHPEEYDKWVPAAKGLLSALSDATCQGSSGASGAGLAGASGSRAAIVNFAMAQVGKGYILGTQGPDTFDCSGLTLKAYEQAGISLPRTSGEQRGAGVEVSASEAKPGDILWWPGHVAIYTGNGRMVGAQTPSQGVLEMAVYGAPVYIRPAGLD